MGKSRDELELQFKVNKIRSESQTDWGQVSSTSPDFVKNRVCYEDVTFDASKLELFTFRNDFSESEYSCFELSRYPHQMQKSDFVGLTISISDETDSASVVLNETAVDRLLTYIDGHLILNEDNLTEYFLVFPYNSWYREHTLELGEILSQYYMMLNLMNLPDGVYFQIKQEYQFDLIYSLLLCNYQRISLKKLDQKFIDVDDVVPLSSSSVSLPTLYNNTFSLLTNTSLIMIYLDITDVVDGKCGHYFGKLTGRGSSISFYHTGTGTDSRKLQLLSNLSSLQSSTVYLFDLYLYKDSTQESGYSGIVNYTKVS